MKARVVETNRCVNHVVDKLSKAVYRLEQKTDAWQRTKQMAQLNEELFVILEMEKDGVVGCWLGLRWSSNWYTNYRASF